MENKSLRGLSGPLRSEVSLKFLPLDFVLPKTAQGSAASLQKTTIPTKVLTLLNVLLLQRVKGMLFHPKSFINQHQASSQKINCVF